MAPTNPNFIYPKWPAPKNIVALTTTRTIGNLATHVALDRQEAISNRSKLYQALATPPPIQWLNQTHSVAIANLTENQPPYDADACYTQQQNQVCAVLTADCLPVLITNKSGTEVAAIHAGWRGLYGGIIAKTIQSLKSHQHELLIWLGPAIGPKCYELSDAIREQFLAANPQHNNAFIQNRPGHWLADLYQIARNQLQQLGINQIFGANHCTYSENTLFYSYRREKEKSGRIASLIWIIPD
jgi:YfiH family protein